MVPLPCAYAILLIYLHWVDQLLPGPLEIIENAYDDLLYFIHVVWTYGVSYVHPSWVFFWLQLPFLCIFIWIRFVHTALYWYYLVLLIAITRIQHLIQPE